MQFILTRQSDGRYFGRMPDSDDGNGNEIDCLQETPELALESLLRQHKETLWVCLDKFWKLKD